MASYHAAYYRPNESLVSESNISVSFHAFTEPSRFGVCITVTFGYSKENSICSVVPGIACGCFRIK